MNEWINCGIDMKQQYLLLKRINDKSYYKMNEYEAILELDIKWNKADTKGYVILLNLYKKY